MTEQSVEGWASMWRKAKPGQAGALIREADRLGQRPLCLAGLIRSTYGRGWPWQT